MLYILKKYTGKEEPSSTWQHSKSDPPSTNGQTNPSRNHNPRQTKATKNGISWGTGDLTMEEKIIKGLPVQFTQAAPINHDEMCFPKVVHSKNFP